MNWKFTAPDLTVRFEEGEPFCHFFPLVPGVIDEVDPEIHDLDSDPILHRRYYELRLSRQLSNGLKPTQNGMVETHEHHYEHNYHNGVAANGEQLAQKPRRRFTVRSFTDLSSIDVPVGE
jgi:hypothetical protein